MLAIFDYTFSYKHIIVVICLIAGLVSLSYAMYGIYSFLKDYSIISSTVRDIYDRLCEANKQREKRNMVLMVERGNENDSSLLAIVDRLIAYSGIAYKFRWLNTEVALTINIIACTVLIVAAWIISRSILLAIIAVAIVQLMLIVVLTFLADRNYIKVEDTLTQFMGCVENFSSTGNDIITILDKASKYIDPVIGQEVSRCVIEAKNSGNQTSALARLENKFQNKYWQIIIRNLSICARYSCNYSDAIAQLKDIIDEYITYEKEKREEYRNNRIMIAVMLVLGFIAMVYVSQIMEMSMAEMITSNILLAVVSIIGLVIVVYISIIKGMLH